MPALIEAPARTLRSPVRNRYFWGKLLDAEHLELEQRYHNRKRWLLNRHGLGTGVLCGLDLERADGERLWLRPGVAIDGLGREIVVPESFCIEHPDQPTDACGRPEGDPVRDATLWICLAYHECDTEPVRALEDGCCDPHDAWRANAVRERFRVRVRSDEPPVPESVLDGVRVDDLSGIAGAAGRLGDIAGPPRVSAARLEREIGVRPTGNLAGPLRFLLAYRQRLCRLWGASCGPADPVCVPLGLVRIDAGGQVAVQPCTLRRQIPSNADLLDALLLGVYAVGGLVEAMEDRLELAGRRLDYDSGDAQTAKADTELAAPIAVKALDAEGRPLDGVQIRFRVMGGGGGLGDPGAAGAAEHTVATDAAGLAAAGWKLGAAAGLNTAEAVPAEGPGRIGFVATGT